MSGVTTKKAQQEKNTGQIKLRSHEPLPQKSMPGAHADILALQRSAGNRNVDALLRNGLGNGRPMAPAIRHQMEQRFGRDFGRVRLHDDAAASASAEALSAKAYTVGNHIVFNQSRFSLETSTGKRLLAHEIAHVVQQGRGGSTRPTRDGSGPLENAAAGAAASFAQGSGPVTVQGSSALGVACEPGEEVPWWKRKLKRIQESASGAVSAIKAAPGKLIDTAEQKYASAKQEVVGLVDQAKKKYETAKKTISEKVGELNTKENQEKVGKVVKRVLHPSVLLADATSMVRKKTEARAAQAKGDPSRAAAANAVNNFATAADNFTQSWARLDAEPTEKFAEAAMKDGLIAGVKAWQKSRDEGLTNLTNNFKQAVNDYEDGKFEAPPQALIDSKSHPTLARIEEGLQTVNQAAGKVTRQIQGGVAKAVWTMGAGIVNIAVHPVNTIKGLGEMPSVPGMPNTVKDIGQAVGFLDDLITSDKSAKQVLGEYIDKQRFDPRREMERSMNLMKGLGENYIEAAGYKVDPKTREIEKGGEARWGEIPGLLLVDVGSFLIPGLAGTKGSKVAGAAGRIGESGKALGTVGKVETGLQAGAKTGELVKGVETGAELARPAEVAADLGKAGEATRGGEAVSQATKVGEETKGAQAAAAPKQPLPPGPAGEPKAASINEPKSTGKSPAVPTKSTRPKAVPKQEPAATPKAKPIVESKAPKTKPALKSRAKRPKPEITAQPKQGSMPPEGFEDIFEHPGMGERKTPGGKTMNPDTETGLFAHEHLERIDDMMKKFNKEAEKYIDDMPKGENIKKEFPIDHPDYPPGRKPRVDRLDWDNAKVYEIKPRTDEWIRQGTVEGQQYVEWLNKFHKRPDGKLWTFGGVITYDKEALKAFLINIGVLK